MEAVEVLGIKVEMMVQMLDHLVVLAAPLVQMVAGMEAHLEVMEVEEEAVAAVPLEAVEVRVEQTNHRGRPAAEVVEVRIEVILYH